MEVNDHVRYLTIKDSANAQYEIQKSRFISFVERADSEDTAADYIQKIKKMHWEARHHCSAYIVGHANARQKADDDGEPSGTAGKPILEVLKKNGVTDAVIVVVRYFGGIKLGAGGLIRAYGKAASLGLEAATIVEKVEYARFALEIDYSLLGSLENQLRQSEYLIEAKEFGAQVRLIVLPPKNREEKFLENVKDWTSSRCEIAKLGETHLEFPIEK